MRDFAGLKPKNALDFTGFSGTPKMFRDRFRELDDGTTQLYSPERIRRIRMQLLNIPQDAKRPKTIPPIILGRMAKGGVGKTTTIGNVGACLAMHGYRVLEIDGDPQASLTELNGINSMTENITHIAELMKRNERGEPTRIREAVRPLYEGGMLDLIPSDITMADDTWLIGAMGREHAFQRLLEKEAEFFSEYDVILIDAAPGASVLATTFMVASKTLLAVVAPEGLAITALDVLAANVYEINQAFGKSGIALDVHIVVNKYNQSKQPHNANLGKLIAKYPGKINDTIVREFIGFIRETDPDNLASNGPVLEKSPTSAGARDIIDLTRSLVKLYDIRLAGYKPFGMEAAA